MYITFIAAVTLTLNMSLT